MSDLFPENPITEGAVVPVQSPLRFGVLQENLLAALKTVSGTVAAKNSLPVLANVLFRVSGGVLTLSTNNLVQYTDVRIGCTNVGEIDGGFTLPCAELLKHIINYPKDRIDIVVEFMSSNDVSGVYATITDAQKTTSVELVGIDALEFPVVPPMNEALSVDLSDIKSLQTVLNAVSYASATDDTRPVLCGVQLTSTPSGLVTNCADGFRLARATIDDNIGVSWSLIIPAEFAKRIATLSGACRVLQNGNLITVETESITIGSRLIDGKFPDVERVIPIGRDAFAILDAAELIRLVKIAFAGANKDTPILRLVFENGKVNISSNSEGVKTNLNITGVGDGSGTIALNGKFLLECIQNLGGAKVRLEIQQPTNPFVMKPETGNDIVAILMPMTVK